MQRALYSKAQAHISLGQVDKAIESFKATLNWEKIHPYSITNASFDLPYLAASLGLTEFYNYALEVLSVPELRVVFPVQVFKQSYARAIIYRDTGKTENSKAEAKRALEAAHRLKSPFKEHSGLGLVGKEYTVQIEQLKTIVAAVP